MQTVAPEVESDRSTWLSLGKVVVGGVFVVVYAGEIPRVDPLRCRVTRVSQLWPTCPYASYTTMSKSP